MTSGRLSTARLGRMHDVLSGFVERGQVPGIVTLIERRGELRADVIGEKALGSNEPMRRDTIFRISSMTKPVTAVAAMMLVEECRLRLDDTVDGLLPELADRQVLKRIDGPLSETVPANRPITVRDLLTFRMGFGMVMGDPEAHPILQAVKELQLGEGPPLPQVPPGPDEWIRRLGTLPLMYQPGERWMYNTGSNVLGVLIQRASGQPLETFFRERIFDPLGMKDTAFTVPEAKLDRLATSYSVNSRTGALQIYDGVQDSQWGRTPAFADAAAGLVSTADDYLTFGRMMLNKGRHGNHRLLARPSVETMITDQLTPAQKAVSGFFPGYFDNRGWGFGVSVVTGRDELSAVPGRFGWDGGLGTSWFSDPAEEMVAILMTQRSGFPLASDVYLDFWTSVYQAIDD